MLPRFTTAYARRLIAGLLVPLVTAACADAAVAPQPGDDEAALYVPLPARMMVVLADGISPASVTTHNHLRAEYVYSRVFNGFVGTFSDAERTSLLLDDRVIRVVYDENIVTSGVTQSNATWGLDRIDQRSLPLDKRYTYEYTGQGVTAYIFDTGINFGHAEFEGRAVPGFDAIGDGRNGADCNGHGTHVAGTVGGKTYGVAKGVRLVSIRIMDCAGGGYASSVLKGIDWVLANNSGPAVANFSLSGSRSETMNAAIRDMIAGGVQASIAAGNQGGDACERSPASTLEAITVGATTSTDARRSSSNYGDCVDLFAPGTSIVSASYSSSSGTTTMSGTSMAAPHAAGVLALLLEESPSLTGSQLQDVLIASATKNVVDDARSANAHLLSNLGAALPPSEPVEEPAPSPEPDEPPPSEPEPLAIPSAASDLALRLPALNRVELNWRDNSANEDGFIVQRRRGNGDWVDLIRVGANTTAYTDQSVLRGESYTWRIVAYNAAGEAGASNEASLTIACATKGKSQNCQ